MYWCRSLCLLDAYSKNRDCGFRARDGHSRRSHRCGNDADAASRYPPYPRDIIQGSSYHLNVVILNIIINIEFNFI